MTATLTRPEPRVEQDEFSQAPAKFPAPQPNGDAEPHDALADPEPTLAEAQAIRAKATEEADAIVARAVAAERGAIDALIQDRDALTKTIDEREKALMAATGGKVRKKRTPKALLSEAVSSLPTAKRGRPPKSISQAQKDAGKNDHIERGNPLDRMVVGTAYTSNQAKALFNGAKPGEVLAEAIEAKLVKKTGIGAGSKYTRTK